MSQSADEPPTPKTPAPANPVPANPTQPNQVSSGAQRKDTIAQFVTTIRNPEAQVGQHIIQALQHDDTVAVLTTVALGADGQQRVISVALNPERMAEVQEILTAAEKEREDEEPCFGFHCLVKPKR
ncbi:hypothetical protein Enr13x_22890 [Stieleria neptunia]|uniref:Uncharacterized protein n=1 Tax=Stieleria neptunia TaxID=2527979 RepID=A0A518HNM2_9BACT|nr:hypothetical protein [Stieleria neptunia]QDV42442.1 hypothetical protein Enr13x_22890 [Stieleria neptunia]